MLTKYSNTNSWHSFLPICYQVILFSEVWTLIKLPIYMVLDIEDLSGIIDILHTINNEKVCKNGKEKQLYFNLLV